MSNKSGASRVARRGRKGKPKRVVRRPSALYVERILRWADAYRTATGRWPDRRSGPVSGTGNETWSVIDSALSRGRRGLPGGSSLVRLLDEKRGVTDGANPAPPAEGPLAWEAEQFPARRPRRRRAVRRRATTRLTIDLILTWADAHHAATGLWPRVATGRVLDHPILSWGQVNYALREGRRGMPGGTSLADLLLERRGVRNKRKLPRLDVEQILAWADAHREATGEYPHPHSGPVAAAPGETWAIIHMDLCKGFRGLPGGSTLARLLAERRGYRRGLTVEQILAWADAHRAATGRWPSNDSGPVAEGSEMTWKKVNMGLYKGLRGLPGGSSLARLLAQHRPVRPRQLSLQMIRAWARTHREATGRWPSAGAGPVRGVPDVVWAAVDGALRYGYRGLPGGSSLAALFHRSLNPAARGIRPELTVEQVLAWADAHRAATGRWPTPRSGPVDGVPGERWANLDMALRAGRRGLPRGMTLSRLIAKYRGAPASAAAGPRSRGGPNTPADPGAGRHGATG